MKPHFLKMGRVQSPEEVDMQVRKLALNKINIFSAAATPIERLKSFQEQMNAQKDQGSIPPEAQKTADQINTLLASVLDTQESVDEERMAA